MRDCALHLHQVQGTLRMVELYGAAMVVEEMERVAAGPARRHGQAANDEAYSVLMRGIVQLPDYLERLQSGHKDIPIVLLPLLNDLRAARGEKLLTESVLFSPDLAAPLPAGAGAALPAARTAHAGAASAQLRSSRAAALDPRRTRPSVPLARMSEVLDRLRTCRTQRDARRLWWVAGGVLDGVRIGGDRGRALRSSCCSAGSIARSNACVDDGENAFAAAPPRDLTKNLLYYIAHADGDRPRAPRRCARLYKLDTLLPSAEGTRTRARLDVGPQPRLLDTVSVAIKDDLLRVKEALDIFLRAQRCEPGRTRRSRPKSSIASATRSACSVWACRARVVTEQRKVVEEMADSRRPTDEATLLDVAGALLYVEASLDDHIERLGAGGDS